MEQLNVKQGDYGYNWQFTIVDAEGNAENITDYTIKITIWHPKTFAKIADGLELTKSVPANGTCYWTLTNIFTVRDTYYADLELSKANYVDCTETFIVNVIKKP